METNKLLLGDCLDLLPTFPDNFFDAFISDVPYGLGKKQPSVPALIAYLLGSRLDLGGDFMGTDWEIPSVAVWQEVYRVLKPGAHLLCFGGTRSWDLISLGIRAAGFELRDTIGGECPHLQWVYAQGMPKTHNVGTDLTKLVEDEAKLEGLLVEGLGTGLKPSWEPILFYRKPFKGSVAKNVLKHGTGALNINVSRVRHSSKKDFDNHKKQVEDIKARGGQRGNSWKNSSDLSGANDVTTAGRWPGNIVFTHHQDCKNLGSHMVKRKSGDISGNEPSSQTKEVYGKASKRKPYTRGKEGFEEVSYWLCVDGCPVAELNQQSGTRKSTLSGRADPDKSHEHPGTQMNPNSTFLGERSHLSKVYADEGGLARYFMQFPAFKYATKANRNTAGLGKMKIEHPTLKPLDLMRYLVKLVTPKGGVILDPYCGSGTTCHAAALEECSYVGIEKDEEAYAEAMQRLQLVKDEEDLDPMSLF